MPTSICAVLISCSTQDIAWQNKPFICSHPPSQ